MAGARLFFRIGKKVSVFDYATLFDASFLAGEAAEVVEFGAAHFTVFVYDDRIDEGGFYREDTLNADVVAHFAHGEALFSAFSRDADHNTAIQLDTLFVTFFDTICHGDSVAGAEFGMLLAGSEGFFGNFNQVHCKV